MMCEYFTAGLMRMCNSITSDIRRARLRRWCRKNGAWLLMAVPGLALIFVFSYIPMFGIVIAFKNYQPASGIVESPWIGLRNFEFLFGSNTAWRITINTLYLNAIFIITSTIAALSLALLINEIREHS